MFSIVIPNYNNARYLDELFESIINQTFENYEIIFIDDVSEDESLEKAKGDVTARMPSPAPSPQTPIRWPPGAVR